MVLVTGVEPVRGCPHGILSPGRLPIPPHQQKKHTQYSIILLKKSNEKPVCLRKYFFTLINNQSLKGGANAPRISPRGEKQQK